jgi:hypothetical protein
MSTFFKTAFMATLVLSALIGLDRLQVVGVEPRKFFNLLYAQASQGVCAALDAKVLRTVVTKPSDVPDDFKATFEPDPNDPPTTTGGSGTR